MDPSDLPRPPQRASQAAHDRLKRMRDRRLAEEAAQAEAAALAAASRSTPPFASSSLPGSTSINSLSFSASTSSTSATPPFQLSLPGPLTPLRATYPGDPSGNTPPPSSFGLGLSTSGSGASFPGTGSGSAFGSGTISSLLASTSNPSGQEWRRAKEEAGQALGLEDELDFDEIDPTLLSPSSTGIDVLTPPPPSIIALSPVDTSTISRWSSTDAGSVADSERMPRKSKYSLGRWGDKTPKEGGKVKEPEFERVKQPGEKEVKRGAVGRLFGKAKGGKGKEKEKQVEIKGVGEKYAWEEEMEAAARAEMAASSIMATPSSAKYSLTSSMSQITPVRSILRPTTAGSDFPTSATAPAGFGESQMPNLNAPLSAVSGLPASAYQPVLSDSGPMLGMGLEHEIDSYNEPTLGEAQYRDEPTPRTGGGQQSRQLGTSPNLTPIPLSRETSATDATPRPRIQARSSSSQLGSTPHRLVSTTQDTRYPPLESRSLVQLSSSASMPLTSPFLSLPPNFDPDHRRPSDVTIHPLIPSPSTSTSRSLRRRSASLSEISVRSGYFGLREALGRYSPHRRAGTGGSGGSEYSHQSLSSITRESLGVSGPTTDLVRRVSNIADTPIYGVPRASRPTPQPTSDSPPLLPPSARSNYAEDQRQLMRSSPGFFDRHTPLLASALRPKKNDTILEHFDSVDPIHPECSFVMPDSGPERYLQTYFPIGRNTSRDLLDVILPPAPTTLGRINTVVKLKSVVWIRVHPNPYEILPRIGTGTPGGFVPTVPMFPITNPGVSSMNQYPPVWKRMTMVLTSFSFDGMNVKTEVGGSGSGLGKKGEIYHTRESSSGGERTVAHLHLFDPSSESPGNKLNYAGNGFDFPPLGGRRPGEGESSTGTASTGIGKLGAAFRGLGFGSGSGEGGIEGENEIEKLETQRRPLVFGVKVVEGEIMDMGNKTQVSDILEEEVERRRRRGVVWFGYQGKEGWFVQFRNTEEIMNWTTAVRAILRRMGREQMTSSADELSERMQIKNERRLREIQYQEAVIRNRTPNAHIHYHLNEGRSIWDPITNPNNRPHILTEPAIDRWARYEHPEMKPYREQDKLETFSDMAYGKVGWRDWIWPVPPGKEVGIKTRGKKEKREKGKKRRKLKLRRKLVEKRKRAEGVERIAEIPRLHIRREGQSGKRPVSERTLSTLASDAVLLEKQLDTAPQPVLAVSTPRRSQITPSPSPTKASQGTPLRFPNLPPRSPGFPNLPRQPSDKSVASASSASIRSGSSSAISAGSAGTVRSSATFGVRRPNTSGSIRNLPPPSMPPPNMPLPPTPTEVAGRARSGSDAGRTPIKSKISLGMFPTPPSGTPTSSTPGSTFGSGGRRPVTESGSMSGFGSGSKPPSSYSAPFTLAQPIETPTPSKMPLPPSTSASTSVSVSISPSPSQAATPSNFPLAYQVPQSQSQTRAEWVAMYGDNPSMASSMGASTISLISMSDLETSSAGTAGLGGGTGSASASLLSVSVASAGGGGGGRRRRRPQTPAMDLASEIKDIDDARQAELRAAEATNEPEGPSEEARPRVIRFKD